MFAVAQRIKQNVRRDAKLGSVHGYNNAYNDFFYSVRFDD